MKLSTKKSESIRIIFLGDVVGRPGRKALKEKLAKLRTEVDADIVIVNGENAAGGAGIDPSTAIEIKNSGADLITLGDHAFQRKAAAEFLDSNADWCIRPANFPADTTPGKGWCRFVVPGTTIEIVLINLLGRLFIQGNAESPFFTLDEILSGLDNGNQLLPICDFHAEATSEKWAMARHADGRLAMLVGTHTHVQTSDAQILPGGTAYITDLGMTGSEDGVIGMKSSVSLKRFLSPRPAPYEIAPGEGVLRGVIADFCTRSLKALAITAI